MLLLQQQVISYILILHITVKFLLLEKLLDSMVIFPLTHCVKKSGANNYQYHMLK